LLPDRSAIGRLEIDAGIEDGGDRAQIDGKLPDGFAGDQSPAARVGDDRREQRKRDVGDAARGEQRFDAQGGGESLGRKSEHEHHRDQSLHADRHGPSPEPGDYPAGERDRANGQKSDWRPRQGDLDRAGRCQREREAEPQCPSLLAPRGRVVRDARRKRSKPGRQPRLEADD
jgi:hypothetical protein